MILAVQQAYYVQAKNPSDIPVLTACAQSIGLDATKFAQDIVSDTVEPQLQQQLQQDDELRLRAGVQGFPSLVLKIGPEYHPIPVNYQHAQAQYFAINTLLETANKR